MLNERAQALLKTLVERYIAEGQPVGSRALSRYSGLELSPASIRNVMADLEEMGFISSPHTSAGRVPTARGYRLFVDTLLKVRPLADVEINQLEGQIDAVSVERHGPDSSSAARRNTATRSWHGVADHAVWASRAAAIARSTCDASPFATSASTWSWSCGMTASNVVPVSTRSPPMTSGMSIRSPVISASRCRSAARSGLPGA